MSCLCRESITILLANGIQQFVQICRSSFRHFLKVCGREHHVRDRGLLQQGLHECLFLSGKALFWQKFRNYEPMQCSQSRYNRSVCCLTDHTYYSEEHQYQTINRYSSKLTFEHFLRSAPLIGSYLSRLYLFGQLQKVAALLKHRSVRNEQKHAQSIRVTAVAGQRSAWSGDKTLDHRWQVELSLSRVSFKSKHVIDKYSPRELDIAK